MTNKDYRRKKVAKQAKNKEISASQQSRARYKKIISIIVAVVLVAVVGSAFALHVIKLPSSSPSPSFVAPSSTPWGSGEQISNSNFGNNVHIYYISWYGCPLGATDSWAFFLALNSYLATNLSSHGWTSLHTSLNGDIYGNTPGLLFSSFSYKNVVFTPVYVYNQTMTGTVHNVTIPSDKLVSEGLSEINSSVPSSVSSLEYKYLYQLPIAGKSLPSFLQFRLPHVNTNIIITGPNGAWLFNGALYNPSTLRYNSSTPYTPQYVMSHLSIIDNSAVVSIMNAIKSVA